MTTEIRVDKASEIVDASTPVHQNRERRQSSFLLDDQGHPTGGHSTAEGIDIHWQDGVKEANGAILEDVLALAVDRLEFFQGNGFSCRENALAITHIQEAIGWLNRRTLERMRRGVEGTYTP